MKKPETPQYEPDRLSKLVPILSKFVHGINASTVPDPINYQAKLCIIDTVGCILAGKDTSEATQLLNVEQAVHGGGDASVLGSSTSLSTRGAARVNGYLGDIFELNDLIGGHASIGNVTTALAVGESVNATSTELLEAIIAGIEVTARVYSGYYTDKKSYTESALIGVGIPSTFGTAAVASVLHGLSEEQTTNAMAIGGTLAGWCPAEAVFGEGGSVKPMLFGGWPASVGILAARYANVGITGPHKLLESDIGFYSTVGQEIDTDAVINPDTWYLASPRRKLHSCCGYIHAAIDAVHGMQDKIEGKLDDIEEINVGMADYTIPAVSKEGSPSTPNEARFHAEYCIALAVAGNEMILPDHSQQFDAYSAQDEINGLVDVVNIHANSDIDHYGESTISIRFTNGNVVHGECAAPRGAPGNPLSEDQVIEKFRKLALNHAPEDRIDDYIKKVKNLEDQTSCDWIFSMFN